MTTRQQGDVVQFQTDDGGDIIIEGGIVAMSGGLETSAYLALFGGNEDDDGREGNVHNWWANIDELTPERQYRSETQHLLQSIPATTGNLRRIEDAARRDLAYLVDVSAATSVKVSVGMPAVNRVRIIIDISGDPSLEFVENWTGGA